jgi:hypothetical protein
MYMYICYTDIIYLYVCTVRTALLGSLKTLNTRTPTGIHIYIYIYMYDGILIQKYIYIYI